MPGSVADQGDEWGEDYRGWPLRQRLKLLAFDARLAGVPPTLLEALWEAIDRMASSEQVLSPASQPVSPQPAFWS